MPTVIDSFVAEFTIDPTDFQTGANNVRLNMKRVREDVDKTTKANDEFGKRGAEMFSKLRNEAVGLFLAFQGASSVKDFVTNLLTGDAATARLAGNLGVATNTLSAWQLAVQKAGGDAKDADAAFSAMAAAYQSFVQQGTTGHDPEFRALLGPTWTPSADPEDTLLKLAAASETMDKMRFFSLASALGIPPSVINTLEKGRGAVQALIDAKKREGAANDDDAAAAQRLLDKQRDLADQFRKESRPAIYGIVDALDKLDEKVGLINIAVPVMTGILGAAALAAVALAAPFVATAAAIGAIVAFVQTYKRVANRGVQDVDLEKSRDNAPNGVRYDHIRSASGKTISAETLREIQAGERKGGGGAPGTPGPGVAGREAYIRRYLASQGLTAQQVNGIVAGMRAENKDLDPNVRGGFMGRAVGIGQWLGDRRSRLLGKYGNAPNLQQQLEFLVAELKGGDRGGGSVLAQRDPAATMVAYLRDFMRPQGAGGSRMQDLIADIRRGYGFLRNPAAGNNTVNIQQIVVNAPNADPKQVAAAIPEAMRRRQTATQANRGLR